jgi:glycosyltransferase involved in cell wall biosynthesis
MRVRIVLLTPRFWPATGGVEKYVARLARALRVRGHQPTVVAGAHASGLADAEDWDGLPIHRFPAHRSPVRAAFALARMRDLFARADVVHVSDALMLDYFYRAAGWLTVPRRLGITLHGMSCVHPVPQRELDRARRARLLVDGMVHDGAFIERWLGVSPDAVIPQGLDPPAAQLAARPEPERPSAIYVGRLEPDTGVELYLDALAKLRAEHGMDLPLDVHGDGTMRAMLKERTDAQKLRVRFHGTAPNAQERIADHTLALVSGRMAIHEALARRRAVVAAYNNPIRADYVRAEAFSPFIATGGSGAELAGAIARLIAQPEERKRVTQRGFAHVRELTWERTAGAYLQLWTSRGPAPSRLLSWSKRVHLARRLWRTARGKTTPYRVTTGAEHPTSASTLGVPDKCH